MSELLTIAMPKGRIFEEAAELLRQADFQLPPEFDDSRKLIVDIPEENMRFILAKPMDVTTYVEYGVADLGIAGKDVMLEEERDVYELLDLNISKCHLAVAGLPNAKKSEIAQKVATKYPNVASTYFREQGEQVEIIKLNGSIELAPLIGLADRIVDIVSTGQTLKENGLVELEHIEDITSRLIVNPVSYRLKDERIDDLVNRLAQVVQPV
ncbi:MULTISPECIES: ATP phosphoribosyltransferase [Priestia]|jgi:ATP phosphoribosyltransferase|uniref:ATP phosphoribosyltransferase n=6 Tax=Priestia TaxID=2800373 RepID=D5DVH6_PRIM1|nr:MULTISPECIES: ATP phosphoribosyltransferase [Priestia]AVX10908.1 ATP phosphoribosyltransferase [Bacillus sp. Y-01]KOP76970.1 ATP phosphoribosyltransferase [Bacillus sp. FJAT-21351]KQU18231.1 ATP phosphoribosyltransferase [Bacillus sp. Leaf75]KRD82879.1 ATP phosphoribosyltransferase [Bacillus sp. Root147]KRD95272.1 ATP phosphoribosyltransferase [Bacillus sp. Root239]KRF47559.1 ATP phosphoribosyltransferase [Bacillus sp. Soil531]MBK0009145.1 ATP phosphoribosyltransferase [Bacillus sp. S35]